MEIVLITSKSLFLCGPRCYLVERWRWPILFVIVIIGLSADISRQLIRRLSY